MKKQSKISHAVRLAFVGLVGAAALAGCGSGGVDSGGLTAADRNAAQAAMNALQASNIPLQLVNLTVTAGLAPAACQVHLESKKPSTFKVYVFWNPYTSPQSYTWLDMTITKNATQDKFHLGTAPSVPVNKQVLIDHAGDVFSKPGAKCQVLMNGYLKLLPNP